MITVLVLTEHIISGDITSLNKCPIALALQDCNELKSKNWIVESYRITDKTNNLVYRTPESVSTWMDKAYHYQANKKTIYYERGVLYIKKSYDLDFLKPLPFEFQLEKSVCVV